MYKKVLNYFVIMTVALFSVSLLSACSDDKDSNPSGSGDIVGKWDLRHVKGWEKEDGEFVDKWDGDVPSGTLTYVFEKSGKCMSYVNGEYDSPGTYELRGDKLTVYFTYEGEEDYVTYTCKINGNSMTLIEREEDGDYEDYEEMTFKRID